MEEDLERIFEKVNREMKLDNSEAQQEREDTQHTILPTNSSERKHYPMFSGLINYFPDALAAVSHNSYLGNEKHNPNQPLHWSKHLSPDHADCIVRHLTDSIDPTLNEIDELTALAWRALALLQTKIEENVSN